MRTLRIFKPIEEDCDYWDDARPTIVALLPKQLSFAMFPDLMRIDFSFLNDILEAVPDHHRPTLDSLSHRLSWVARYLPNTLPMPIEYQHLQGLVLNSATRDRACHVLWANDQTRRELGVPTSIQLFRHGLGVACCPVPLDPDWR